MNLVENSRDSLTRRSALNTLATFVAYGVRLGIGLLVSPLLLGFLGSSVFGIWQICQRLLTYVESAEGRGTQALKWVLANSQEAGSDDQRRRALGSAVVIWLAFLPLVGLAGAGIVWLGPRFINELDPAYLSVVRWTCFVLVLRLMVLGIAQVPEAALQGMNLGYRMTPTKVFIEALSALLMVGAAWVGAGLVGLAASMTLIVIVSGLMLQGVARRQLSWYGLQKPSRTDVRGFFGFSAWVFAWTFVNKFLLFSDVVILGLVLNAKAVTHYTLTLYPSQLGVHISAMLVSSAIPGLGGLIGAGEFVRVRRTRGELMTLLWLFLLVLGSGVLLFNASFVGLWVGPDNYCGPLVNLALMVMVVQQVLFRADAFLIDATLDIRAKVLAGALAAAIGVTAAYILGHQYGILGVVVGQVMGRLLLTVYYPYLLDRALAGAGLKSVRHLWRPVIVMAALYYISWRLGQVWLVENWLAFVVYAALVAIISALVGFFVGLSKPQRSAVRERVVALYS